MSLKASYTFLAPLYDLFVGPAFDAARRSSLAALPHAGRTALIKSASFDCAVLHLILAVVPDAARALAETARVVSDEPAAARGWFRLIRLERL